MRAAGEPLDQLAPPVDYELPWGWVAVGLVLLVAAWYAAVLWWGRPGAGVGGRAADRGPRRRALRALDALEREVDAGRLPLREAHQRTSEVLRGFVEEVGELPARSMALADLRAAGASDVAAVVALLYPPEFGVDADRVTRERFADAVERAREVVRTWT